MAPRVSMLDIETADGPLQLRDLAGNIRLRATNGPVALVNVSGIVETSVTNGPISLTGASGDHRVLAVNRFPSSYLEIIGMARDLKCRPLMTHCP